MTVNKTLLKRIILVLAVLGIAVIECFKTNASFESAAVALNCIGFCIFPFVALRFRFKDFLRLPYYIWAVLGGIMIPVIYHFFAEKDVFTSRFLVAEFNVYTYGFIIIRLFIMFFIENRDQKERKMSFFFYAWAFMMFLCVLSINRTVWPLWYLMMFGSFYLAPLDKDDKNIIFESMVDGLIVAFFMIQSLAFLYRPYYNARYWGFFANSNMNALFYLVSYSAVLIKIHLLRERNNTKMLRALFFVLSCALWSFVYFTACRCALLGFVAITLVYLIVDETIYRKRGFKGFMISGVSMLLVFLLSLFPVYAAIRYFPQLRHHPVFFGDEYDNSASIKSEDINDASRYVSFTDAMLSAIGRLDYEANAEIVSADYNPAFSTEQSTADAYFKEVRYGKIDVILGIRKYVWMYFGSHLNVFGHEESYEQIQVTPNFACNHPHNSFLFFAYGYGTVPGVLFFVWAFGMPVYILIRYYKEKEKLPWQYLFTALTFLDFICYGFFETSAYPGRTVFTLLFLTSIILVKREKHEEIFGQ